MEIFIEGGYFNVIVFKKINYFKNWFYVCFGFSFIKLKGKISDYFKKIIEDVFN